MAPEGDVFAERLLQVIDEGRRISTYKMALLLALIDGCAERAGRDGRAPEEIHTRTIARHAVRIYLPQVRQFTALDGNTVELRQITSERSAVLLPVLKLQMLASARGCSSFASIEAALPEPLDDCLDHVELAFAKNPVLRLQVVGASSRPFLYDADWTESVTLKRLHANGGGMLRFRPGAGDHLLRLAPLVRPLIEVHWVRMVSHLNRLAVEEEVLRSHLFGSERVAFTVALRAGLTDFQQGRCFYCRQPLSRASEVDHFLPWSRWPNDAIENLVLADPRCNGLKSNYLPALTHVQEWTKRFDTSAQAFAAEVATTGWPSEARRSLSLARSCYAHLPSGTPLWSGRGVFADDDPVVIAEHLQAIND